MRSSSVAPDLATRLRTAITRTARRMRQAADSPLSPSQASALASIERHGPLSPSRLATIERIQRPTVTRLLTRLEEAGHVERRPDPADGRSALINATPQAVALLAEQRIRKDAFLAAALERLEPADRATLERATELLEALLEEEPS
jgi:DNA-binding MarR family transcriptional regulator